MVITIRNNKKSQQKKQVEIMNSIYKITLNV